METEFMRKIGFVFLGFLLFIGFLLYSTPSLTGAVVGVSSFQLTHGFFFLLLAVILLILALLTRGNPKELIKNFLGIVIIFVGFYAITLIAQRTTASDTLGTPFIVGHLVVGLLSLTFGVMALIWAFMARRVLSIGSSLRSYVTSFFFCLLLLLVYSLYDLVIGILQLTGIWIYFKYLIITFAYLIFVHTSYKIYKLGHEFGFLQESQRIKKALKK